VRTLFDHLDAPRTAPGRNGEAREGRPVNRTPLSLGERFAVHHERRPEVYRRFKELALRLLESGRSHYGAKSIMETVRFHCALDSGEEEYKINNSFTALYVRMLIQEDRRFEGFFELRVRKTP
jgi:hypothetical protein